MVEADKVNWNSDRLYLYVSKRLWNQVKSNFTIEEKELEEEQRAVHIAVKAIQTAAMIRKFKISQQKWKKGYLANEI